MNDALGHRLAVGEVDLVEHDHLRALQQCRVVATQLVAHHPQVAHRVTVGVERCGVEHVQQHVAALDVTEELVAEPAPLGRTLDESGHVGEHDVDRVGGVTGAHDAQVRGQRRERPRLDPGGRDTGHELTEG